MDNWEKIFNEIKHELAEQERIVNLIQSTKMYHAVEGIHNIRKKNDLFTKRGEQIGASLKHILGNTDDRIQKSDALAAVKKSNKLVNEKLDQMQKEYEIKLQYEELYNVIREKVNLDEIMLCKNLHLLKKIDEREKCICVMAPIENIDLPDGYSRRIKNIDMLLEKNRLRIYMSKDYMLNTTLPIVQDVSEDYVSIKYNPEKEGHCILVTIVAEKVGKVYIHSAYQTLNEIAKNKNIIKIYDFHGVVPEELLFMGNEEGAEKLGSEESVIVKNATYIVVANNAMKRHILKKYPSCKSEFILFPMNNADNDRDGNGEAGKNNSGKPVVIYSGGLQKWQLIPEMQDAMERQKNSFDYRMYVSDTEEFMKLWSDRERPDTWRVDTLSAEELKKEYEKAQYGFTLRDEIIVNEVACPTKLIDYVKYGIIPILKFDKIGDFIENGLEYVKIEDFINGRIPSEEKRVQMVQNNFSVMEKIYDDYKKGLGELQEILERI
mgnify:FL=1